MTTVTTERVASYIPSIVVGTVLVVIGVLIQTYLAPILPREGNVPWMLISYIVLFSALLIALYIIFRRFDIWPRFHYRGWALKEAKRSISIPNDGAEAWLQSRKPGIAINLTVRVTNKTDDQVLFHTADLSLDMMGSSLAHVTWDRAKWEASKRPESGDRGAVPQDMMNKQDGQLSFTIVPTPSALSTVTNGEDPVFLSGHIEFAHKYGTWPVLVKQALRGGSYPLLRAKHIREELDKK